MAERIDYELYSSISIGSKSMEETVIALVSGDVKKVKKLLLSNDGTPLPVGCWEGDRRGLSTKGQLDSFHLAQALFDTLRHDKSHADLRNKSEEIWKLHKNLCKGRGRILYEELNFIPWNWESSPGDNPYFLDNEEQELLDSGVSQGNICMTNFGIQHMEKPVKAMLKAGGNPYFVLTPSCSDAFEDEDGEIYYSYIDVAPMLGICSIHSDDYWADLIRLGFGIDISKLSRANLEYVIESLFNIGANERILHLTDKYITEEARKEGEKLMMKYLGKIYPIV